MSATTVTIGAERPRCQVVLPGRGAWACEITSGTDPMPPNVALIFTLADGTEIAWMAAPTGVSSAQWTKTAAEVAALLAAGPKRARLMQGAGDSAVEWLRDGPVTIA